MRLQELSGPVGFRFPAESIKLDAEGKPVWIPAVAEGEYHHPKFGKVPITRADLSRMFDNFKNGQHPLPNVQLPIDYEHLSTKGIADRKPGDGEAGGWIQDVRIEETRDGRGVLMALVDWTKDAAEKIRDKKYRYFSPTFHPAWKSLNGGKDIGVTLLGGAMTNHPTIPDCVLTCSMESDPDLAVYRPPSPRSDPNMKTIKLKNEKNEEVEIPLTALGALTLDNLADVPAVKELRAKVPAEGQTVVAAKDFAGLQQTVTTLSTEVERLKTDNASLKTSAEEASKKAVATEIDGLIAQGRILPRQKDMLVKLSAADRPAYDAEIAAAKQGDPIIKMSAQHGSGGEGQQGSAVREFDTLVEQKRKDNPKLTYAQALALVAQEKPDLERARRLELNIPIQNGGIPMISAGL
jgi:phage I-like protein